MNSALYLWKIKILEIFFNTKSGSKERDELEVLSILIDIYEKEYYQTELPNPC